MNLSPKAAVLRNSRGPSSWFRRIRGPAWLHRKRAPTLLRYKTSSKFGPFHPRFNQAAPVPALQAGIGLGSPPDRLENPHHTPDLLIAQAGLTGTGIGSCIFLTSCFTSRR